MGASRVIVEPSTVFRHHAEGKGLLRASGGKLGGNYGNCFNRRAFVQISRPSVWARLGHLRDRERDRLAARLASGKDLMVRVDQLNLHLVLAWRHPGQVDCIEITSHPPTTKADRRRVCADARPVEIRRARLPRTLVGCARSLSDIKSRRCPEPVPRQAGGPQSVLARARSRWRGTVWNRGHPSRSVRRHLWRAEHLLRLRQRRAGPLERRRNPLITRTHCASPLSCMSER